MAPIGGMDDIFFGYDLDNDAATSSAIVVLVDGLGLLPIGLLTTGFDDNEGIDAARCNGCTTCGLPSVLQFSHAITDIIDTPRNIKKYFNLQHLGHKSNINPKITNDNLNIELNLRSLVFIVSNPIGYISIGRLNITLGSLYHTLSRDDIVYNIKKIIRMINLIVVFLVLSLLIYYVLISDLF